MIQMVPNGFTVTMTPAEKVAIIQNYRNIQKLVKQLRHQFGDDPRRDAIVHREFGLSFFKKLGRSLKKVSRTVLKPVGKIAKAIVRSPITKAIAGGIAVVYPAVGVPLTAALVVADKAISMAESADKARQDIGKMLAKNTKTAALTDPGAARAFQVMKTVHQVRQAAGVPAGAPMPLAVAKAAVTKIKTQIPLTRQTKVLPGLPAAVYKGLKAKAAAKVTAKKAPLVAKPVPAGTKMYGGFVVTTDGHVIAGKKIALLAGDYA